MVVSAQHQCLSTELFWFTEHGEILLIQLQKNYSGKRNVQNTVSREQDNFQDGGGTLNTEMNFPLLPSYLIKH